MPHISFCFIFGSRIIQIPHESSRFLIQKCKKDKGERKQVFSSGFQCIYFQNMWYVADYSFASPLFPIVFKMHQFSRNAKTFKHQ